MEGAHLDHSQVFNAAPCGCEIRGSVFDISPIPSHPRSPSLLFFFADAIVLASL